MKATRETIISSVVGVAFLALMGAVVWLWFNSGPADGTETIAVTPGQSVEPSPPPVVAPPVRVQDPTLSHLVPTDAKATFVGTAPPEPPLADNEVACFHLDSLTILSYNPDRPYKPDIAPRTLDSFALVKFDLSPLRGQVPKKARLKGCVFYIENTGGYHTPVRYAFHRLKTDWDDSATYRYANAREQVSWPNGMFTFASQDTVDPTPVATTTVANPPPPGFNVDVDVTPLVTGWMKKEFPDHGLLICTQPGRGFSEQANLKDRKRYATYHLRIICTMSGPVKRDISPTPRADPNLESRPQRSATLDLLGRLLRPPPTTQKTMAVPQTRSAGPADTK